MKKLNKLDEKNRRDFINVIKQKFAESECKDIGIERIAIHRIKDITGDTFGKLKVLEFSHFDKKRRTYWLCECSCENKTKKSILGANLKRGNTKTCGCSRDENMYKNIGEKHKKH